MADTVTDPGAGSGARDADAVILDALLSCQELAEVLVPGFADAAISDVTDEGRGGPAPCGGAQRAERSRRGAASWEQRAPLLRCPDVLRLQRLFAVPRDKRTHAPEG
ncbi:hypothetical protein [Streptomyces sp. NPDC048385]|uniref:hypothetical protein n=1 Tax=unclassified Streptomyces TaxID=2593676 RepID=UPI00342166FB